MFHFLKPLFASITSAGQRRSPARKLMEAAQVRAGHSQAEAQELRRAAFAQLSVVR